MQKLYIGKNAAKHYEAAVMQVTIDFVAKALTVRLNCYEVTQEGGEQIVGETVKSYERRLVADNATLVDAQGNYLPDGETEGVGEWDFFQHVAGNVPVKVNDLIMSTLIKNRSRLMPDNLIIED